MTEETPNPGLGKRMLRGAGNLAKATFLCGLLYSCVAPNTRNFDRMASQQDGPVRYEMDSGLFSTIENIRVREHSDVTDDIVRTSGLFGSFVYADNVQGDGSPGPDGYIDEVIAGDTLYRRSDSGFFARWLFGRGDGYLSDWKEDYLAGAHWRVLGSMKTDKQETIKRLLKKGSASHGDNLQHKVLVLPPLSPGLTGIDGRTKNHPFGDVVSHDPQTYLEKAMHTNLDWTLFIDGSGDGYSLPDTFVDMVIVCIAGERTEYGHGADHKMTRELFTEGHAYLKEASRGSDY
jgi:hypothetical protein